MTMTDHEHVWGAVELAHFTGNPHRKCTVGDCNFVTLDLHDDEITDWTVRYACRNANSIAWSGEVTVYAGEDTVEECARDEIRSGDGPEITEIILVDFIRHPVAIEPDRKDLLADLHAKRRGLQAELKTVRKQIDQLRRQKK